MDLHTIMVAVLAGISIFGYIGWFVVSQNYVDLERRYKVVQGQRDRAMKYYDELLIKVFQRDK